MVELVQLAEANALVLGAALVLVLLVAWWLLSRSRAAARQRSYRPDVLDEGVAPASRNQALIDAPSAATAALAASGPDIMAGLGEIVAAAMPATEATDDLTRIKGVGPKLAALLATLGVTRFSQIAVWSDADLARIDSQLGAFAGRPARDNWVEQARLLAAGDTSGYEARFGKL
jgi:predicted flap endonuclease-1-like 5' DNA nuclease